MNEEIYKKVTRQYGVSVDEVKRDMQAAIDAAYQDPNVYAQCASSGKGAPATNEFVDYAAEIVNSICAGN